MATPAAPPVFTSAAASRLPEDRLSAHEQQVFQYSSGLNNELQSLHLRMRNACLARWLNRPQLLLPKDVFVSEFIKGQPAMTVAESTETPAGQESSGTSFSSSLAAAVWSYLHRYRYINYGILQTPPPQQHTLPPPPASAPSNPTRRPSIVVLGAGIAGIAAARELHTLYSSSCIAPSHLHLYPSIIILEAKQRLGGRILSYPLHTKRTTTGTKYLKAKAASGTATATTSKLTGPRIDLGAQVVLGLENGNPLKPIIQGQLNLDLFFLGDSLNCPIFDSDGNTVNFELDQQAEETYNLMLDECSKTAYDTSSNQLCLHESKESARNHAASMSNHTPVARSSSTSTSAPHPPPPPGLGKILNYHLRQTNLYASQHRNTFLKLVNWHAANLEYGMCAELDQVSLEYWDHDDEFEFAGWHSMCVGGYAQIPYALAAGGGGDEQPVLDIRYDKAVDEIRVIPCGDEGISGDESPLGMVRVTCSDGSYFDADAVVVTAPLGVLQHSLSATSSSTTSPSNITQQQHLDQTMDQSSDKQHQLPSSSSPSITFSPPLPPWKVEAINRLGFGFFTKVVLVFKEMFWDPATSIFGCLNEKIDDDSANSASSSSHSSASTSSSSSHPSASSWLDSASTDAFTPSRGQFFTFWNMYPVTGVPVLVGFISGRAAVEMDTLSDDEIVGRALVVLKKIFCGTGGGSYHGVDKQDKVVPLESIVSRWNRDEYTRGAYTHVSPGNSPTDYDTIAKPIWNNKLFFAGEHTSRKFPATVHGAMLAGMEAASGVADVLMGPCVVRTTGTTIPAPLNLQTTTGCVRSGCTHTEISSNLSLMDHAALCHQPPLFKSDVMSVASATSNFGGTYKTIGPYQQQQQVQPPRSQQHPQHSIVKDIVMEPVCPNAVQPSSIDNNEMVVDENQPQSHTIPPTTISQNQQLQPRIQVAVAASSTATYCQPPPVIPLTELSEKVGDNQSMQMEL